VPAPLIDTHAHLDDERFGNDLPAVLQRAADAGVTRIVTVATTAASTAASIALAARHAPLFATAGIHPNNAAETKPGDWDEVVRLAGSAKVVALGETGLDRHWNFTPFPLQEDYFARHLELLRRCGLPVVIHSRDCDGDILRMLREDFDRHGPVRGVMHSFSGEQATAEACLTMGLYLSFAGMVTYKNAQALRDVAARVPAERLLVETDSPYLAPVPVRGQRNEPAFVAHTAACLAGVRGVSAEELREQTTRNARDLFRFDETSFQHKSEPGV
jgi:TatD DNase family protein